MFCLTSWNGIQLRLHFSCFPTKNSVRFLFLRKGRVRIPTNEKRRKDTSDNQQKWWNIAKQTSWQWTTSPLHRNKNAKWWIGWIPTTPGTSTSTTTTTTTYRTNGTGSIGKSKVLNTSELPDNGEGRVNKFLRFWLLYSKTKGTTPKKGGLKNRRKNKKYCQKILGKVKLTEIPCTRIKQVKLPFWEHAWV